MGIVIFIIATIGITLLIIKTIEIGLDIIWDFRHGSKFADEILLRIPNLEYIEDWREAWSFACQNHKREDYLLLKLFMKKEEDLKNSPGLLKLFSFLRKYAYSESLLFFLISLSIPLAFLYKMPAHLLYGHLVIYVLLISLTIQVVALLFNNLKLGFVNNFHLSVYSSREENGVPIYRLSTRTLLANSLRVLGRCFAALIMGFAGIYSSIFLINPNSFKQLSPTLSSFRVWLNMIYYSVITVSTTGYGDLGAAGITPRLISAYEIVLGFLYITVLVIIFSHTIFPEKPDWILELRSRPQKETREVE